MIAYCHLSAEKLGTLFAGARQRLLDPLTPLANIALEINLIPEPQRIPYSILGDPVCVQQIDGHLSSKVDVPALLHQVIAALFHRDHYYTPPCGTGIVVVMLRDNSDILKNTLVGVVYPCWPKPQSVYWGTLLKFARKGIYDYSQTPAL